VSKFKPLTFYEESLKTGYKLLPFRFTKLEGKKYVASNLVGEFVVLDRSVLAQFANGTIDQKTDEYNLLKSKHFLIDDDSSVALDLLALKLRTKLQVLSGFTALHIFVVSLRCEHSCPYCQVSRQTDDKVSYDMSAETAERALQMVFKSPSPAIKIEFQGGEPLLNFERIKDIVLRAKEINCTENRELQFVIASNLALISEQILEFCRDHDILISTSLDGPIDLHNKNRPRPGKNSYQKAIEGIEKARTALGDDRVSALMTTTKDSLGRVREIIDEYIKLKFDGIFLRSLSPYGFALKTKQFSSYDQSSWFEFYKSGLDYIIELNKSGLHFVEYYAATILTKMLTPFNPGYVDLMSPSGIGISVLVYNYDGDVYASDESRMLAEMGDKTFCLGNIHKNTYEEIILSEKLLNPLEQSFAESAPMCSDCAFEAYCGAEPVYHHATQGDYVGRKPSSDFCARNMGIFRLLIKKYMEDPETAKIFRRWVSR